MGRLNSEQGNQAREFIRHARPKKGDVTPPLDPIEWWVPNTAMEMAPTGLSSNFLCVREWWQRTPNSSQGFTQVVPTVGTAYSTALGHYAICPSGSAIHPSSCSVLCTQHPPLQQGLAWVILVINTGSACTSIHFPASPELCCGLLTLHGHSVTGIHTYREIYLLCVWRES